MPTTQTISEVLIANLALSRMGSVTPINSLDTTVDSSVEAQACALWYPQDRDDTLTDWPWPWAQSSVVLSQVNTLYPATPEYQYSYRYPADCLDAIRVVCTETPMAATVPPQTTGVEATLQYADQWWKRPDGNAYPWGFRVGSDTVGRLILTDLPNATLIYTRTGDDPTMFSADFVSLLAWRLAVSLSDELASSERRAARAEKGYKSESMKTRARFANEQQDGLPKRWPNSEFVRRRF